MQQGGADPLVRVLVRHAGPDRQTDGEWNALLRTHPDGRVELLALEGERFEGLDVGEVVVVGRAVPGDAMYVQPYRVVPGDGHGPTTVWLVEIGDRRREQQREHVRVDTPPVDIAFHALGREGPAPALVDGDGRPLTVTGLLADVSAGGLRAALPEPVFLRGSRVHSRTVLPGDDGDLVIDLPGEVRWVRIGAERTFMGVQFEGVRPALEQRLTAWVFAQQAKQRRSALGA